MKGCSFSDEVTSVTVIQSFLGMEEGSQGVSGAEETLGKVARFPAPPNLDLQKGSNLRKHRNIKHTFPKVKTGI